MLKNSEITQH